MAASHTSSAAPFFYGLSDEVFQILLHEPPPNGSDVPEALVHDLWQHQRFDRTDLSTIGGMPISVRHPGRPNSDAGPDFLDVHLKIGSTSWRGAVEIHTTSGIWIEHGHDRDAVYNSTLLHVSLYADIWTGKLRRADGTILPEMVLFPRLDAPLRRLIHAFHMRSTQKLPCASGWQRVPDNVRQSWIRRLGIERFTEKMRRSASAESLDRRLFEDLFSGLGYAKNAGAMRTLARVVTVDRLRALEDSRDVEAVLLGCAGLIPHPADLLHADRETADYAMALRDRFERINHRLDLAPMPATAWRFFRLRPANFPPLRIAQAAGLCRIPHGFLLDRPVETAAKILVENPDPISSLRSLFNVELSEFWKVHVRLDRRSKPHAAAIGAARIDALLVNALLPILGMHAQRTNDEGLSAAVLSAARLIPASSDVITRQFQAMGTSTSNALDAQGLHQLFRTRCKQARCLTCDIGHYLLSEP